MKKAFKIIGLLILLLLIAIVVFLRLMYGGGKEYEEIRVTPSFGQTEVITDFGEVIEGGHGGADMSLKNLIFRGEGGDEGLQMKAGLRAGALASLMGIAAYKSIDRNGQKIYIADLANL